MLDLDNMYSILMDLFPRPDDVHVHIMIRLSLHALMMIGDEVLDHMINPPWKIPCHSTYPFFLSFCLFFLSFLPHASPRAGRIYHHD